MQRTGERCSILVTILLIEYSKLSWDSVREVPTAFNPFGSKSLDISEERNYMKGPIEREGSPLHAFWVSPSTIRHTTLKKIIIGSTCCYGNCTG